MKSKVHPRYKTKYRVANWAAYNQALVRRGDVTLWLSSEAIAAWTPRRGRRGWRKLHLGVDQSGVILVHTLTEATGDDATTALDLLNAVEGPLVRVTADAAYDTVAVYETAGARGATVVIHRPGRRTSLATARGRPRGIGRSRW